MPETHLSVSVKENPKTGKFIFVVNTTKKHYTSMTEFFNPMDAYRAAMKFIKEKKEEIGLAGSDDKLPNWRVRGYDENGSLVMSYPIYNTSKKDAERYLERDKEYYPQEYTFYSKVELQKVPSYKKVFPSYRKIL